MPRRETYAQGSPCWVDYMAADPEGARDFYASLFGWTFDEPEEYGYRLARQAGEVVGGFGRVPPGRGLTPTWNTYLAAKDADAVAGRVTELGGTVVFGPLGAGEDGRFLFAVDATGASVGFWQGHWAEGIVLVDEYGATCGHELWAADPAAAGAFYTGLFGEEPAHGREVRGVPHGVSPQWVSYFLVDDVPSAAVAAERAGGRVAEVWDDGRAAVVRDPWGALFGVRDGRSRSADGTR
ncbi:VOC family protein [Microbispora sp. NBRC 16548]|uniref:VOC family protein n=1 Tax=Microbispora sp. NBRC 16548 TaxID=3030994 RepID=UPI0024A5D500|nr:VOC family protein [Microbispora sp. NBRC 16548]GLX07238.1 putative glyoxylase CFP32 [Microbispora sp. NBRC 16548]